MLLVQTFLKGCLPAEPANVCVRQIVPSCRRFICSLALIACICKARYLHGTLRRKSGRHKYEGRAHYPGRPVSLPCATDTARCRDGLAGVPRAVAASIGQRANSPRDASSPRERGGRNRRIRDPYVRRCGRTAGVTPPPTRFRKSQPPQYGDAASAGADKPQELSFRPILHKELP